MTGLTTLWPQSARSAPGSGLRDGSGRFPVRLPGRLAGLLSWVRVPLVAWIRPVDALWAAFVIAMLASMYVIPDQQTIPYHLIFVSFTLLYGFRLWSPRATSWVLAVVTVITGLMFLRVYLNHEVTLDELAEIPLMTLIVGGMAWHAHRSAIAQRRVRELAALESSQLDRQRAFLRDSAHAIRTPVAIARGNIELLKMGSPDAQLREDADEVLHQLDRLHQLARRLLVIEALHTSDLNEAPEPLPAGPLIERAGRRWTSAAPRTWVVDSTARGCLAIEPVRLEDALDAMVENAVRFTGPGGTIRISCRDDQDSVTIEVADDGPGIPADDRQRVFDRFYSRHAVGEEPGTGLGLALVAAVATSFGGSVSSGAAPEGGALVRLRLPLV